MAAEVEGWISEYKSLKPFIYPVPETRFLHAGENVYKIKIRYGNTVSIHNRLDESVVNEELQDAIRVILGNLDDLCPFTTEHLIIFPCKAEYSDAYSYVDGGYRLREHTGRERVSNWRRLDHTVGVSHTELYADRKVLKNTARVNNTARPRVQEDMFYPKQNRPEETKNQSCDSAVVDTSYDNKGLRQYMEYIRTENTENSQQEGQEPILQKESEENIALKKEGFLELLKSLFPPLLQRIFSGTCQLS